MLDRPPVTRTGQAALLLVAALLLLAINALHAYHFHDRDYRQDEVHTVHGAQRFDLSETAQWMAYNGVHPAGWRVLAVAWVKLVGRSEVATRHLSTLCTLLALALLFRLGADLFGWQVGLYAVFILGTLPFAMFYMHELRPYPLLVLVTAGLLFAFIRWLGQPSFRYALLYVMFGVAGFQTHYFAIYVVIAHGLALVLLVRWDRGRYLRAVGLVAAIGFSLVAWALPLAQRWLSGNDKSYAEESDASTLRLLYDQMQINPPGLGLFLLLAALLIPVGTGLAWLIRRPAEGPFRFAPEWRKLYLLIIPSAALVMAMGVNLVANTLTARNLIILLPPLAVLVAYGLRRFPTVPRLVLIALIAVPAVRDFQVFSPASAPYRALVAFMQPAYQPGDRIVAFASPTRGQAQVIAYYLLDALEPSPRVVDMFLVGGEGFGPHEVEEFEYLVHDSGEPAVQQFDTFLDPAPPRVWYIEYNAGRRDEPFILHLQRQFAAYRTATYEADLKLSVTEYRRVPESAQDMQHFGGTISLQAWTLPAGTSAAPCGTLSVETWWLALDTPPGDYGIGLVLAGASGHGAARSDALPSVERTPEWLPGTFHADTRALSVPCDLAPGQYSLLIGLFDFATFEPLPARLPDDTLAASNLLYLTTVSVEPQP